MKRFLMEAVVLAGGKSSRMGQDKALLPFGGCATLAEYQYRRLEALFPTVRLSAKGAAKFGFAAEVVTDGEDLFAPTVALKAILEQSTTDAVFVLAVDIPFVGEREISRLMEADSAETDVVVAADSRGNHPLCGIYKKRLIPWLERAIAADNHRLNDLLASVNSREVLFEESRPFINLNRPEEYDAALEALR